MNSIKDEVFNVIINELHRDENSKFVLLENMQNINHMVSVENIEVVKEKVYSFLEKLNSSTEEEIEVLLSSDFQEEIYDKL